MFYFVSNSFEVLVVLKWLGEFFELPKEKGLGNIKFICTFGGGTGNDTYGKGQIFFISNGN